MAEDFAKKVSDALDNAIRSAKQRRLDDERVRLLSTVGQDVAQMLTPVISEMAQSARMNKEEMRDAMFEALGMLNSRELNIDTKPLIDAIQEAMGGMKLPEPKVHITTPPIKIPPLQLPDDMEIKGFLEFMGIFKNSSKEPISVQIRDKDGKPVDITAGFAPIGGGGGGGFRRVIIDDIRASSSSVIDQALGAVKVTGNLSASLSLDYGSGEIGANTPRFVMATDAVASVYITGANGTLGAAIVDSSGVAYSGSNPVPVSIITGSINFSTITSTDGVATQDLPAFLGMNFGFNGSTWDRLRTNNGDAAGAMRVAFATDSVASVAGTVVVSSITATVAANLVDSSGVAYSGSNPVPVAGAVTVSGNITSTGAYLLNGDGSYRDTMPISGTVVVSSVTATIAAMNVDSSGVGYSGSNPFPITIVSGALTSTIVVGASAEGVADDGSAPVQQGGISRQANPTAIAGGSVTKFSSDDLGRQLYRPVQVRDLTITAYTSIANGTEATLLAASAGSMHDLIYIMMSNSSDAAVIVDVRGVTGGNIQMSVSVPANGVAGVSLPVPLPPSSGDTGNNWTIDMPDITGTTVYVSALFSREV